MVKVSLGYLILERMKREYKKQHQQEHQGSPRNISSNRYNITSTSNSKSGNVNTLQGSDSCSVTSTATASAEGTPLQACTVPQSPLDNGSRFRRFTAEELQTLGTLPLTLQLMAVTPRLQP
ncbi:hypothetical protein PoB_006348900 [Plakobranchus ocellatus]|uniref:Uncharacterized protein n=1 Tax=Plakobranchus ocellatus TaxID=259542 RepID=A0AAV4CYG6_9GAST|nr:hypothetical protein PoB_006348900 [Plakobranchus ocellatus]